MSNHIDIPIYFERDMLTEAYIDTAVLTRYAIRDNKPDHNKPALTTEAGLVFIDEGRSSWTLNLSTDSKLQENSLRPSSVVVEAAWLNSIEALRQKVKVTAGSDANVFAVEGAFLVPDGFTIPTEEANPENVRYYGLQLIREGETLTVETDITDLVIMQYDYKPIYKDEFLLQKYGGGGVFIETHDFPHIHIPTNSSCHGYIVIGKKLSATEFEFTAFSIPYGCALYTPSNTIHGDGTLVGEYGIAVAKPGVVCADTVLIYNKNTLSLQRGVVS